MSKELSNLPPGYIEPREETIDDLRDQRDMLKRKIVVCQNFTQGIKQLAGKGNPEWRVEIYNLLDALNAAIRAIDNEDWYRALPFQPERGTA